MAGMQINNFVFVYVKNSPLTNAHRIGIDVAEEIVNFPAFVPSGEQRQFDSQTQEVLLKLWLDGKPDLHKKLESILERLKALRFLSTLKPLRCQCLRRFRPRFRAQKE